MILFFILQIYIFSLSLSFVLCYMYEINADMCLVLLFLYYHANLSFICIALFFCLCNLSGCDKTAQEAEDKVEL